MERDFIAEQGYKALDNRLKRISDRMSHDTRKFFKLLDLDVEPSWHLVFKLLKENETLTMVEISDRLGYTHPSMVAMLKKMTAKGYISSQRDPHDKRKQNILLTEKSHRLLPDLEHIWDACEKAILKLMGHDLAIMKHLDAIEASLQETPLNKRFYNEYRHE